MQDADRNRQSQGLVARLDGEHLRIGIVQARFNAQITERMAQVCLDELHALGVEAKDIKHVTVPGALEIPLVLQVMAESEQYEALIALGCVLVDEAQFLSRAQVWQLSEVVDRLRIPVLCYGLRTDFRGDLFEGSQYLLAWADELQEIKTICHSGKKATMNVRVDAQGRAVRDGPQVEIGGNERYVSVSRAEFKRISRGEGRIEPLQQPLPLG